MWQRMYTLYVCLSDNHWACSKRKREFTRIGREGIHRMLKHNLSTKKLDPVVLQHGLSYTPFDTWTSWITERDLNSLKQWNMVRACMVTTAVDTSLSCTYPRGRGLDCYKDACSLCRPFFSWHLWPTGTCPCTHQNCKGLAHQYAYLCPWSKQVKQEICRWSKDNHGSWFVNCMPQLIHLDCQGVQTGKISWKLQFTFDHIYIVFVNYIYVDQERRSEYSVYRSAIWDTNEWVPSVTCNHQTG